MTDVNARNKRNKTKGAEFELDVLAHIRNRKHLQDAERLPKSGKLDEGDLTFVGVNGRFCVEAKNAERLNLGGWIKEAIVEAKNYATKRKHSIEPTPVVVIKARRKSVGEAYVVMRLDDFLDMA